jgi:hypothetical protein
MPIEELPARFDALCGFVFDGVKQKHLTLCPS